MGDVALQTHTTGSVVQSPETANLNNFSNGQGTDNNLVGSGDSVTTAATNFFESVLGQFVQGVTGEGNEAGFLSESSPGLEALQQLSPDQVVELFEKVLTEFVKAFAEALAQAQAQQEAAAPEEAGGPAAAEKGGPEGAAAPAGEEALSQFLQSFLQMLEELLGPEAVQKLLEGELGQLVEQLAPGLAAELGADAGDAVLGGANVAGETALG